MDDSLDLDGLDNVVGLSEDDRKHAARDRWDAFKGEKDKSYRVSLASFYSIETAVKAALKGKHSAAGTKPTKEEFQTAYNKVLARKAEELGKPVDKLEPYEKLDLKNVLFYKWKAYYAEGVGYVKDGSDHEPDEIWSRLGDPKKYFTCLLLIYTDFNKDRFKAMSMQEKEANIDFRLYRMGPSMYEELIGKAQGLRENNLSIANQDLSFKCKDAKYQSFTIETAGPAIWQADEALKRSCLKRAVSYYDKLCPFRDMSVAELKVKLGIVPDAGKGGGDTSGLNSYLDDV